MERARPLLESPLLAFGRTPPPPHDPTERTRVELLDRGWEVRVFAREDRRFAYFVPRGLWHMQLWHPGAGVSVLSPSALTGGRFELFPVSSWKAAVTRWADVARLITAHHGIAAPSAFEYLAARARHVDEVVRGWFGGSTPCA